MNFFDFLVIFVHFSMPVTDGFEYTRARFRTEEQRSCDLLLWMTGGMATLFEEDHATTRDMEADPVSLRRRGQPGGMGV